jgi:hypothetical protein
VVEVLVCEDATTVGVMAKIAFTYYGCNAVARNSGKRCHHRRRIAGDVMAVVHVVNDIAVTGYTITAQCS